MPKRIALFILGCVVVIGAFLLYQHFSGTSYTLSGVHQHPLVETTQPGKTPSYESRDSEGRLEFLITCESFEQLKGPDGQVLAGQVALKKPVATFYDKSGRTIEIRGDTCKAVIDQGFKGSSAGILSAGADKSDTGNAARDKKNDRSAQPLRLGQLSGHVRLTISALPDDAQRSATNPQGAERQGALVVYFDDDLDFDGNQEILSSPGKIYVRSNTVAFDGEGLQLAFNRDARRIEYLRIEKGNQVIIRKLGAKALSLTDATTAPATRSATLPAASANAAATPPATRGAQAKSKDAALAPTTYKLTFGQDVHASVGESVMTSQHLYLIFMAAREMLGGEQPGAPAPPAAGSSTQPAAALAPSATNPTPGDRPDPIAPITPEDLVVRWTGSMEMRPASVQDSTLADGRDIALQAVGTRDQPVEIHDPRFAAKAGLLWYHASEQRINLEPAEFNHVELSDPTHGNITCQEVNVDQLEKRARLLGPGTLEVKSSSGRPGTPGSTSGPTTVAWNDRMDLDLASVADPKNPGKTSLAVRRAVLGHASVRNEALDLTADLLDVLIANSSDTRQPQTLEHLLATGNVVVHSLRRNSATILPSDATDGLKAPRLEVLAAAGPNGALVPSQMIASGDAGQVTAWRFQDEKSPDAAANVAAGPSTNLRKEMITTSRLVADLAAKVRSKEAPSAPPDALGLGQNFPEVSHIVATGGARVDITPPPSSKAVPIVVAADSLDADPNAGTAILKAANTQGAPAVKVAMGEDSIEGHTVELDQNNDTFKIDGAGQMFFTRAAALSPGTQPADAKNAKAPTPMRVTWTKAMVYDDREKLALFTGSPLAQVVDEDPDRGFLKCDDVLKVRGLKQDSTTRPADALADSGRFELDTIEADGNVEARGEQLGPDNALLMRIRINAPQKLIYHEVTRADASKGFDIPGPGDLVVDNFRPEKPGDTTNTAGTYGFHWKKGLNYDEATGHIQFLGGVRFVFQPKKPLNLASSPAMGGGATTHHPVKLVQLDTERLLATLTKTKEAVKTTGGPLGLGEGGDLGISKVDAEGGANLYADEFQLIGDSLHFDALTHIAVAQGDIANAATISQPGQVQGSAPKIIWDMTKNQNALSFPEGFRGNIQGN